MKNSIALCNNNRILYADVMRVCATMAVITLHVCAPLVYGFKTSDSTWWIGNFVESASRFGVPLFVMLSGMLLLNRSKDESSPVFLKKRMIKILIPFMTWGGIYFLFRSIALGESIGSTKILKEFFTGPIYYHLWFIYTIFGLYVITPLLRVYLRHASTGNVKYLLVLSFLFSMINTLFRLPVAVGYGVQPLTYLGYFVFGYFAHRESINNKHLAWLYAMVSVSILITALGTFYLTKSHGTLDQYFYEFLSPNVVFMSIGLFLIIKRIDFYNISRSYPYMFNIISVFSSASFGIYLLHPIVLWFLDRHDIGINATFFHPALGIPLTVMLTSLICLCGVVILRKIPYIKYVLP